MIRTSCSVLSDDEGQAYAEWGVIVGLFAILCITSVLFLGGHVKGFLSSVGSST